MPAATIARFIGISTDCMPGNIKPRNGFEVRIKDPCTGIHSQSASCLCDSDGTFPAIEWRCADPYQEFRIPVEFILLLRHPFIVGRYRLGEPIWIYAELLGQFRYGIRLLDNSVSRDTSMKSFSCPRFVLKRSSAFILLAIASSTYRRRNHLPGSGPREATGVVALRDIITKRFPALFTG